MRHSALGTTILLLEQFASAPHEMRSVPTVSVGTSKGRFVVRVTAEECPECAAHDKRQRAATQALCFVLYLSLPDLAVAVRRQLMQALLASGRNPRAAVEATVREVTCRFPQAKVRVRGHCRVSMTMVGAAAMSNARRIWRFQQRSQAANQGDEKGKSTPNGTFCRFLSVVGSVSATG